MHHITLNNLTSRVLDGYRPPFQVFYSGRYVTFNNREIIIDNSLDILELEKWIFPKERFFIYDESDISWCRFFNVGRSPTYGEIHFYNDDGSIYKLKLDRRLKVVMAICKNYY